MIVTFYSYKGGVGRSMALANVADLMARSGLRVLILDFDLEAPGLEHFFPVDHEEIRGHEGLLDLLLAFKYSMSTMAGHEERNSFKDLDRFLTTIYPFRDGHGGIDLLPAGRRLTDEQIGRYSEELRQFDWIDFYFSWSGELFFEWLRRALHQRYDVALVDSRTGVTEMGGVCAYQLADAIVLLCAANLQNMAGTESMVRHFLSPQVRAVRGELPLQVLIVPARVDQADDSLRQAFERRFRDHFEPYLPASLTGAGLTLWDLQIPYEPRYAFDEQVVTDPRRAEDRRSLAAAYTNLLNGIALLAPDGSPLAALRPARGNGQQPTAKPVETAFDPTTRFAAVDVFISFGLGSENIATDIRELLRQTGYVVACSPDPRTLDAAPTRASFDLIQSARTALVLVGPDGDRSPWRQQEIDQLLASPGQRSVIPVLLPGATAEQIPPALRGVAAVSFTGSDAGSAELLTLVQAAGPRTGASALAGGGEDRNPYPGLAPYAEQDQDVYLGRESETESLLDQLRTHGTCSLVGPAGIGKTSIVFAGVVPALRRGVIPGSERWPVVAVRPGDHPFRTTVDALEALIGDGEAPVLTAWTAATHRLVALLRAQFDRVVLVIDQFEELFTRTHDAERTNFIAYLNWLCDTERPAVILIGVLRSEFLADALRSPELTRRLFARPVTVGPLGPTQLRACIEIPAQRLGLALEPGLADRLLADLADEPEAQSLSLLQFVLHELWENRRDGYLTHAAYESGGALHALLQRADSTLESLKDTAREVAVQTLLKLVGIDDRGEVTRRRVLRAELSPEQQEVLDTFLDARLLIGEVDPATRGGTTVTVAHELLIRQWAPLAQAIEASREDLRMRSELERLTADWERDGRRESYLLRGDRLVLFNRWAADTPAEISRSAGDFLQAGVARNVRVRRRRYSITAVAVAVLLTVVLGTMNYVQDQQTAALRQADATRLAAAADRLIATRPDTAILAGLQSLSLAGGSTPIPAGLVAGLARVTNVSRLLTGLAGPAYAVAISPDGLLLAGAGQESVQLWDLITGQPIGQPPNTRLPPAIGVAFSPDGRVLATAGADATTRLWDVRKPTEPRLLSELTPGAGQPQRVVAFSPDGRVLATAGADATVRFWDVADPGRPTPVGEPLIGSAAVNAVTLSADGQILATANADSTVQLWDLTDRARPRRVGSMGPETGAVNTVKFSPTTRLLATGNDRAVRLWDVGDPVRPSVAGELTGHTAVVNSISFSPDGRLLASASADQTVRLWDVADPGRSRPAGQPLVGHTAAIVSSAFSPNGDRLATASTDGVVRVWDMATTVSVSRPFVGHTGGVTGVSVSPDGRLLATASRDGSARLWDVATGQPYGQPLGVSSGPVYAVAFSPDGTRLATAGEDTTTWLWDTATGLPRDQTPAIGYPGPWFAIAFSPDGRRLASAGADGTEWLTDIADPRGPALTGSLKGHTGPVFAVAFSPDGARLASAGDDATARLWDVATDQLLGRPLAGHTDAVTGVAFSPDGRTLATASADQTARLWDVATGQPHGSPLVGHTDAVTGVGFSPDGRMLATASADQTGRLWDVATGQPTGFPLAGHTGPLSGVAFGPDGRLVATASEDGFARTWDLDFTSWLAVGCNLVNRNLSLAEWNEIAPDLRYERTCPHLPSGPGAPADAPAARYND